MTKIKICGITVKKDIEYINEYKPDYAGFVMFFPKSKRNIDADTAKQLLLQLDKSIKSVAVMVSPKLGQVQTAKKCGFDYVQIHGEISEKILNNSPLPILRAFNVTDIEDFDKYESCSAVSGFVFDAQTPGSGKTFDWSIIKDIPHSRKPLFLAGGLNCNNVTQAIQSVNPDAVDVSSGVEGENGKDKNKIAEFIRIVRDSQKYF